MSEASQRVLDWREKKREEGYQPVTIWIPATVKNQMVNDAFQRHQDLSDLIVEIYLAHPPTKSGRGAALLDRQQIAPLMDQKIAQALARQQPAPVVQPPPVPQPPAGKKVCRKGHAYPASKAECPQCVTLRQRAARQRQAAQRTGAVPS